MKSKIKPTHDNVLVKVFNGEETTKSGIILPESAQQDKQFTGEVVEAGPKANFNPGDKVIFSRIPHYRFGGNLMLIPEKEILATVEEGGE